MATYVGLDWATKGWFGVVLRDDGEWETDLFPSILSVWKQYSEAERICIDIPIGLPSSDRRACDVEARDLLGARGRSVFYTPTREAVYETNLEVAKQRNEELAGFSIQNQAWSIVPRIREVDEFLDVYPSARDRLIETHPEVCFYALNGRTPLGAGKTTDEGVQDRRKILTGEHAEATEIFTHAVEEYTSPAYAPSVNGVDDILDALVAACTARRDTQACSTLPRRPPVDERGLPMRIVYPTDIEQTRLSSLT